MPGIDMPPFESFEKLLHYIDQKSAERIIVVIDEYPYLAECYKPISSLIQKHINQCWKDSKLMLILCGSSMSFMEC